MSKEQIEKWNNEHPKGKAFLAWNLADYLAFDMEPPACVMQGKTEGQTMEDEDLESWLKEEIVTLSIIRQDYPHRFEDQKHKYLLDLEYLAELGKITEEEYKKLIKEENFNFGQ